jgi:hypothetical protein
MTPKLIKMILDHFRGIWGEADEELFLSNLIRYLVEYSMFLPGSSPEEVIKMAMLETKAWTEQDFPPSSSTPPPQIESGE